jgi:hypothetical protein
MLAIFVAMLALIAAHEYAAVVVLMVAIIGVPLLGFVLLALLVLGARCLPGSKHSSRDH